MRIALIGQAAFGLASIVALFTVAAACDIDGQTFSVELVNDLDRPLQFKQCKLGDCDDFGPRSDDHVAPGESFGTVGTVGIRSYYLVREIDGVALGCLVIDFSRRPAREERMLRSPSLPPVRTAVRIRCASR